MPHRRTIIAVLQIFVFTIGVTSLRAFPPIVGATIQTSTYDVAKNLLTVRIVNTSQKDITAFDLLLKVTYPSGVSEYHVSRDFLNNALAMDRFRGTPNEPLIEKQLGGEVSIPVNGSHDEQIPVQTGLKYFEVILDVVAYSDKTAEATQTPGPDALQRLIQDRKATAASIQKANEIIKSVVTDTTIATPHTVAAQRVQTLLDTWKATTHYDAVDMNGTQLRIIVNDLKQTPPDQLQAYVAAKEKERATWADQAQLVKIGGPQ